MSESLLSSERQLYICDLLNERGGLSVAEIVENFSISEATARRDLETLAAGGKLRRVHGGAVALRQAPHEAPILQRSTAQSEEKQRIGHAAAELVLDGETIFLGSGTTVLEVARSLHTRQNLTVITNSLPVMNLFSDASGITLINLGGILRARELSFIGHLTEQALTELHADKVIIGVHAIDLENGLTNDDLPETVTDRAIVNSGRQVIIVADHSKVNKVSYVSLAPLTKINTIVTDEHTDSGFLDGLREAGIFVIVA